MAVEPTPEMCISDISQTVDGVQHSIFIVYQLLSPGFRESTLHVFHEISVQNLYKK